MNQSAQDSYQHTSPTLDPSEATREKTAPDSGTQGQYLINRAGMEDTRFNLSILQQMFLTGLLDAEDLVWTEGMSEWQPLKTVLDAQGTSLENPPAPSPQAHVADTSSHTVSTQYDTLQQPTTADLDHLPASHLPVIKISVPARTIATQVPVTAYPSIPPQLPSQLPSQQTLVSSAQPRLSPPQVPPYPPVPAAVTPQRNGGSIAWLVSLLVASFVLIIVLLGIVGWLWYGKNTQANDLASTSPNKEATRPLPEAQSSKPANSSTAQPEPIVSPTINEFTAIINRAKSYMTKGTVQVLNTTGIEYYNESNLLVSFPDDWDLMTEDGRDGLLPYYLISPELFNENVSVLRYSDMPTDSTQEKQESFLGTHDFEVYIKETYKKAEITSMTPHQIDGKTAVAVEWKFVTSTDDTIIAYSIFFAYNNHLFALQLNIPQGTAQESQLTSLRSLAIPVINQIAASIILLK